MRRLSVAIYLILALQVHPDPCMYTYMHVIETSDHYAEVTENCSLEENVRPANAVADGGWRVGR